MPVDKFGRMSDAKTRDTGVSLTYINNNYVRSDGSTPVSDSIDMKGNTLYNVADPENRQDVATKEYVDIKNGYITSELGHVRNTIYDGPHIIAVRASYCGPLIRDKHQFTFGGNESHNATTGSLIQQSGHIKKIKVRIVDRKKEKDENIDYYNSGNIIFFNIIAFKKSGEEINLLTYSCSIYYNPVEGFVLGVDNNITCWCNPEPNNVNISISEGDILNIRSETSFSRENPLTYLLDLL